MSETYENYIGGEWHESETGETFDVRNPANPDEVIASVQDSSSADATNAIEAAAAAQSEWADKSATYYQTLLRETAKRMDDRSSELAETLCQKEGKTLTEAIGEVSRAINIFYYYASKSVDYGGDHKPTTTTDQNLHNRWRLDDTMYAGSSPR